MNRKTNIIGFILFFILTLFSLAFSEDSITITTYYPSPYGSYNELQTNRLAVGDTSGDGPLTSADQPPANGQIYTARSVIFKPQSPLPESDVRQGELAYKSSDNSLYLYDGSGWVRQGGGMSYTKYCFDVDNTPLCGTVVLGTQWLCDAGFTVQKSLGPWYYSHGSGDGDGCFSPPGVPLCGGVVAGQAYVCSQ